MTHRCSLYLLLLLFSCSACELDIVTGEEIGVALPAPEVAPATAGGSAFEQTALQLVNRNRAAGCLCGGKRYPPVAALRLNGRLTDAAAVHSADMAKMRDMRHTGSDGSKVGKRVSRSGYAWRTVGENVGWNYPGIEAMVRGWFDSPGHCRNMMNADFRELGVAEKANYYTMVLAAAR